MFITILKVFFNLTEIFHNLEFEFHEQVCKNKTEKTSVKDHEALNGLNIPLKSLGVSSRLLETK